MKRAFAFITRCRARPRSATKARRTTRVSAREYGEKGVEFFVYGRSEYGQGPQPQRYPARQTLEASRAVARLHGLSATLDRVRAATSRRDRCRRVSQRRDRGRQSHDAVLPSSARSSISTKVYDELRTKLDAQGAPFTAIEVPEDEVSVADAVSSYLFNSQLLLERRWPAGARRAAGMPRERARRGVSRFACHALDADRRSARLRFAREHEERRRPGVSASARRAERRRARGGQRARMDERRALHAARRVDRHALSRPARARRSRRSASCSTSRARRSTN